MQTRLLERSFAPQPARTWQLHIRMAVAQVAAPAFVLDESLECDKIPSSPLTHLPHAGLWTAHQGRDSSNLPLLLLEASESGFNCQMMHGEGSRGLTVIISNRLCPKKPYCEVTGADHPRQGEI